MTDAASSPRAAAPARRLHDIDWRDAVGRVVWIPAEHRNPVVPRATAMRILRCTEESFAQLCDLGLPSEEGPDGPLYDPLDLKNVGLYSGSGVTEVEVAMRFILSYMRTSAEELTKPKTWAYRLRLLSDVEPDVGAERRVYRPTPETFGGEVHAWDPVAGPAPEVDAVSLRMRQGAEVAGSMTTTGEGDPIKSPEIRRIMVDLMESGVRWQYLPRQFELQAATAYGMGAGSCCVLSLLLEDQLREAGYEAQSYHGWVVAASEIDHGWVEVVDEDGRVKCLDPSFAMLATHNGFGTPEFYDFVIGSKINRMIPTKAPLRVPYVMDEGATDTVTFFSSPQQPAR